MRNRNDEGRAGKQEGLGPKLALSPSITEQRCVECNAVIPMVATHQQRTTCYEKGASTPQLHVSPPARAPIRHAAD